MNKKVLFTILILGAILRFTFLNRFPVSSNWDEVSHGYNAYSILKTGQDEWGVHFPLIFRAFGDYKLPVYIYATILPVTLFGLNVFSVRFVSALAGVLAILGVYLLANKLFGPPAKTAKLSAGHAAAFFLAISPWHFFISRPALEANLALTLVIFGFYFLLRAFHEPKFYLSASIFLSLSLHTYNTARVFVPLLLLATLWFYRKKLALSKPALLSLIIFTLSFFIVIYQVMTGEGTARYQKLTILSPDRVFQIGLARTESKLPPLLARAVHNRPIYFTTTFLRNYLGYFSPVFFTQAKGAQSQFAIPGENLIGITIGFLFLIGLFVARPSPFVIFWLLLAPVAAAATFDPPQALRPNPMIPPIILIAAFGFAAAASLGNRKLTLLFILLPLLEFTIYLGNYFGSYATTYSQSWQYGHKQVFDYLKQYPDKTIIMTKRQGEPHIFYAFYNSLDPNILQDQSRSLRFKQSDWFWTDKVDNVYFVNDWDIPTASADRIILESGGAVKTENAYLVTSPEHLPINASVVKTVNYLDGNPAFIIAKF